MGPVQVSSQIQLAQKPFVRARHSQHSQGAAVPGNWYLILFWPCGCQQMVTEGARGSLIPVPPRVCAHSNIYVNKWLSHGPPCTPARHPSTLRAP